MEKFYGDLILKLNNVQSIANEWKPDMPGVLDSEEEAELKGNIAFSLKEEKFAVTIMNEGTEVLENLIDFCWEWFPDDWDDEEDLELKRSELEEADLLIDKIRGI